jgi:hypothetical protein
MGSFKYAKLKDNQHCQQPDDKGNQAHNEKMLIEPLFGSQIWFHVSISWDLQTG